MYSIFLNKYLTNMKNNELINVVLYTINIKPCSINLYIMNESEQMKGKTFHCCKYFTFSPEDGGRRVER